MEDMERTENFLMVVEIRPEVGALLKKGEFNMELHSNVWRFTMNALDLLDLLDQDSDSLDIKSHVKATYDNESHGRKNTREISAGLTQKKP